jgi:ABC-type branched-subunit amino acid transport system ATPase component
MVLATRAQMILLDEPTAGMGPAETRATAELVRELGTSRTVLVIDHDMSFVEQLKPPSPSCIRGACSPRARSMKCVPTVKSPPSISDIPHERPLLEITGLGAGYGQSRVLWDIDLALTPGEVLALIGRNGVGKTTLLSAIAGSCPLSAGTLRLGGEDITTLSPIAAHAPGSGWYRKGAMSFPS